MVDIYADLEHFDFSEEIEKLRNEKLVLVEKISSLEKENKNITEKCTSLEKQIKNLNENMSSLLKTCTLEIKRKDRNIQQLREEIDSLVFRRGLKHGKNTNANSTFSTGKEANMQKNNPSLPSQPELTKTTAVHETQCNNEKILCKEDSKELMKKKELDSETNPVNITNKSNENIDRHNDVQSKRKFSYMDDKVEERRIKLTQLEFEKDYSEMEKLQNNNMPDKIQHSSRNIKRNHSPVIKKDTREPKRFKYQEFSRSHNKDKYSRNLRRSRSPRKRSRSPYRRSRSPHRKSRSPHRRSKSPFKNKYPYRKRSCSPYKKRSHSPFKKKSNSPLKKKSNSPFSKKSSPFSKKSNSPFSKKSNSPLNNKSESSFKRLHSSLSTKSQSTLKGSPSLNRFKSNSPQCDRSGSNEICVSNSQSKSFSKKINDKSNHIGNDLRQKLNTKNTHKYLEMKNDKSDPSEKRIHKIEKINKEEIVDKIKKEGKSTNLISADDLTKHVHITKYTKDCNEVENISENNNFSDVFSMEKSKTKTSINDSLYIEKLDSDINHSDLEEGEIECDNNDSKSKTKIDDSFNHICLDKYSVGSQLNKVSDQSLENNDFGSKNNSSSSYNHKSIELSGDSPQSSKMNTPCTTNSSDYKVLHKRRRKVEYFFHETPIKNSVIQDLQPKTETKSTAIHIETDNSTSQSSNVKSNDNVIHIKISRRKTIVKK